MALAKTSKSKKLEVLVQNPTNYMAQKGFSALAID